MQKSSFILLLVVALLLTACERRDYKLLSKKKMVNVMTEMYLTEGAFDVLYLRDQQEKLAYYDSLFKKYGITRRDFEKSAAYYSRKPKAMEQMYERVLDKLKKTEEEVKELKYHPDYAQEALRLRFDSIDIWPRMIRRCVWNTDSAGVLKDFAFDISDTNYFAKGDRFALSFLQRTGLHDSLEADVKMFVRYSDGTADSVMASVEHDSLLRRYRMCVNNVDSLRVVAVYGSLIGCDTVTTQVEREFDSVKLIRIYDKEKFPLNDSIRRAIRAVNNPRKGKKNEKQTSSDKAKKNPNSPIKIEKVTNKVS